MRRRTRTRIGRLRHRVTVQSASGTRGTRGEVTGSWSTVEEISAGVESLTGKELEVANHKWAEASYSVKIRKPADFTLTTKHRFLFESTPLQIGYVSGLERQPGEEIEVLCKQVD